MRPCFSWRRLARSRAFIISASRLAETARQTIPHLSHCHWHKRHRVIAEDVDDFDRNNIATWLVVRMRGGFHFQIAVLAGTEALPFILEDVGAGPAFLKVVGGQFQLTLGWFLSWQKTLHAAKPGAEWDLDDFLPAFVIEIHRPVVHPSRSSAWSARRG
jgi:hypothetical protein